jgi:hypothetical protein
MGSGPLAQPLFYQYRCTHGQADRLCCNGSGEIPAIHARFASITIKRSNLIALDLLQSPATQPREVLDRLPAPQPITPGLEQRRHRSRGRAALPATPTPAPERRTAVADWSPAVPANLQQLRTDEGLQEMQEKLGPWTLVKTDGPDSNQH